CPSLARPSRYCKTAQVAPPWCGSLAIMPLRRTVCLRESMTFSRRDADLLDQTPQHLVRVEILVGQRPGRPAVVRVIRDDALGAGEGVVQRAEGNQPRADGVMAAKAGVLDQSGLARGQVANR